MAKLLVVVLSLFFLGTANAFSCFDLASKIITYKAPISMKEGLARLHYIDDPSLVGSGFDFMTNFIPLLDHFKELAGDADEKVAMILMDTFNYVRGNEKLTAKTQTEALGYLLHEMVIGRQFENNFYVRASHEIVETIKTFGRTSSDPFWSQFVRAVEVDDDAAFSDAFQAIFSFRYEFQRDLLNIGSDASTQMILWTDASAALLGNQMKHELTPEIFGHYLLGICEESLAILQGRKIVLATGEDPISLVEGLFMISPVGVPKNAKLQDEVLEALHALLVPFYKDGKVPHKASVRIFELVYEAPKR